MNRFEFYSNVEKFKNNQSSDELSHYGIIGQKWGTRRWQNADGTFNDEGKIRYFGKKTEKNPNGTDEWSKLGPFDKDTLKNIDNEGYNRNDEDEQTYLNNVFNKMNNDFSYDDTDHKLQTSIETFKKKSGNCHDQTLFEKELFEEMGLEPKTLFFIEVNPSTGRGGVTHSFVYFEDPKTGKVTRFENAWESRAGINIYESLDDLKDNIAWEHWNGKTGDYYRYPRLVWGEFKGEPGDDLQEIVNKSLS